MRDYNRGYSEIRKARRRRWKGEEYMNRKSRKQRGEAEVSILISIIIL